MANQTRKFQPLPETDPNVDFPVSMSLAERESLAAEATLLEERKRKEAKTPVGISPRPSHNSN
jgi:hypothetical protein